MLGLRVLRCTGSVRALYRCAAAAGTTATYRAASSFKVDKKDLKERLTAEQYHVTQEKGTERYVFLTL